MNNVAVTDGDKVAFEQVLGYRVDYVQFSTVLDFFDKGEGRGRDGTRSRRTSRSMPWLMP